MQLANTRIPAALIALSALTATGLTCAFAADYYAGKSIDLLIGAPPGGGYDIYARALARHYGRHIPGQPSIVAKNMPGAGSARAPVSSARWRRETGRRSPPSCLAR
jgi:tripartite-type tricarboxylate transporter receptor subunit TctC